MNKTSIIFDLDGTLLDTLEGIAKNANRVLTYHKFPVHPKDAYRHFVGDGLRALIERIMPNDTDSETVEGGCRHFADLYRTDWRNNCSAFHGIDEMLSLLKDMDVPLAVLSNKPDEFAREFVYEFFPENTFEIVFGQREGFPKKPDPGVALDICKKMNCAPADAIFVGDSGVDMKTGKNANMMAIGVSWGFRSIIELQENGADKIINSPVELVKHVVSFT